MISGAVHGDTARTCLVSYATRAQAETEDNNERVPEVQGVQPEPGRRQQQDQAAAPEARSGRPLQQEETALDNRATIRLIGPVITDTVPRMYVIA